MELLLSTPQDIKIIVDLSIKEALEDFKKELLEPQEPKNLSVQQTSRLLGVTEQSIHNYIKKGILPATKIGRRIIISRTDINNALSEVKSTV